MNLTISGHHLEVTPAIREYVQNKLERVRRHFDQVIDIAVILTVDNLTEKEKRQKAEINLRLPGKTSTSPACRMTSTPPSTVSSTSSTARS